MAEIAGLTVGADGIDVRWTTGAVTSVVTRWLRDACRCPECRDPTSGVHLLDVTDLDGFEVVHAVVVGPGIIVDLIRSAGSHRVHLSTDALRELGAPTVAPHCVWGAAQRDRLLRQSATAPAEQRLAAMATEVARDGISLARDLTSFGGSVLEFGRRLGSVRRLDGGEVFDEPSAASAVHTSHPYRDDAPTVEILHCLGPSAERHRSRFVDGFLAAERLRIDDPNAFACLSTTVVTFVFRSGLVDLRSRRPIIEVDATGIVRSIAMDNACMEPPPVTGNTAVEFYRAYRRFTCELQGREAVVDLPMGAGDVVVFDNRRVLHGRTGRDGTDMQRLQRCHIDIDSLASTARRLRRPVDDAGRSSVAPR